MNTVKIYRFDDLSHTMFQRLKAAQMEAAGLDPCSLVWNNGFELHVCMEVQQAEQSPGETHATVDLGEIHLAAVTTNTSKAMI